MKIKVFIGGYYSAIKTKDYNTVKKHCISNYHRDRIENIKFMYNDDKEMVTDETGLLLDCIIHGTDDIQLVLE